jgi:arylsulfatase A
MPLRDAVRVGSGRVFLLIMSLAALITPRLLAAQSPSPTAANDDARRKTNFLIILCDDLGYGDLACFGNPVIQTLNLDKLASQGMRLTSCYSAAPVCSPSRAGLLTGRNPNRFGIYDWIPEKHPMHLGRGEVTIAQLLQRAGYATGHFGKWHCNGQFNSPTQPQPGDQGFDYWFSTQNNAIPTHHNPVNFVRNGQPAGPVEGYSCQVVTDEALRWLRTQRPPTKPFFAFVCFHETHEQVASPPELVAHYPEAKNPNQAAYFANVTNADLAAGRLLAALDELGETERTFVLFTSDNGPETLDRYPKAVHSYGSPGPLRGMKLHIYDGGIRVPGIIRWPGHTRAGQVIDEPVCSLDLLPTVCAIAGIEPPHDRPIDGTSILPVFDSHPVQRDTPMFWFYYAALGKPKAAIRDGDWKLVAHWDVDKTFPGIATPEAVRAIKSAKLIDFELYNLREDIGEKRDLAADQPQRVQAMAGRLRELFGQVQTECPVWPAATRPARKR